MSNDTARKHAAKQCHAFAWESHGLHKVLTEGGDATGRTHVVTGPVPLQIVSLDVMQAGESIRHLYAQFSRPDMTEESRQDALRLAVEVWRSVEARRPAVGAAPASYQMSVSAVANPSTTPFDYRTASGGGAVGPYPGVSYLGGHPAAAPPDGAAADAPVVVGVTGSAAVDGKTRTARYL